MREMSGTESPFSRVFSNRFFLFLWVIGCLVVGARLIYSSFGTKDAFSARDQAEKRLKEEEQKGIELIEKLNKAESQLEEERRIRNELNMQKPGEIILQLPSPKPE